MSADDKSYAFGTRLVQMGRRQTDEPAFVNPPIERGSSVIFPTIAARNAVRDRPYDQVLTYGLKGTPTHFLLEDAIAEIEGGTRCQIVSTGLAAVTTTLFAYLKGGEHCLMPDNVYGPARNFMSTVGKSCGMEVTYYPPTIDEAGLRELVRDNTRLIHCESPGSHTMEVQDVPMLARVARDIGAKSTIDNTWGLATFNAFKHGVDCSIQAGTKYIGGHSDIMLGTITTNSDDDWQRVRSTAVTLGQYASPDDCWLALRGLRTLRIRLAEHMRAGLEVAAWVRDRPEVSEVLHPALPGAPGHDLWKRDFTGAPSLFTVVLDPKFANADMIAMIDGLKLFGIAASWGGYESLALPTTGAITRTAETEKFAGQMFRLHVGLEDTADLIADLAAGFEILNASNAAA